mmetsp:Transcript_31019/g.68823  ORF Transcript_31019/g.68823 Transcript_31019/m.68823 type:complete len:103 (-) Transcript_31019:615-923(-)
MWAAVLWQYMAGMEVAVCCVVFMKDLGMYASSSSWAGSISASAALTEASRLVRLCAPSTKHEYGACRPHHGTPSPIQTQLGMRSARCEMVLGDLAVLLVLCM